MTDVLSESSLNLRAYWHPVAWASEVSASPYATLLLDEPLVIWRSAGEVQAARDRCPHRGTALSLGTVEDELLVCAYHGWRFDTAGRVHDMPQLGPDGVVPRRACVETYSCIERYGIVWVALEPPIADVAPFAEWEDAHYRHIACRAYTWASSAGRMVENFTDFGHFGYLHDGLLGARDDLVVPAHRVEQIGRELHYELTMVARGSDESLSVTEVSGSRGLQTNTYVLSLPYSIHLACRSHDTGAYRTLYFAAQPRTATESTGYCYLSRNFDLDADDEPFADVQKLLVEQDRPIVESQLPPTLPLEASAELHLPFDRVAVAYRRALRDLHSAAAFPDRVSSSAGTDVR